VISSALVPPGEGAARIDRNPPDDLDRACAVGLRLP